MRISLSQFKGEIPKLADNNLRDDYASEAVACRISNGNLAPYRNTEFAETPSKVGTKLSIYLWNATHSSPGFWFHWLTDVDAVRGPVAGDVQATTYYTGDGVPKRTNSTIATSGGSTDYPTNSYTLGVPAPLTAPTVTAQTVTGNITGATQAKPVVITNAAHGRSTGDRLYIENVVGMTELNNTEFQIAVIDANTYSLQSITDSSDIDGTGYTAYTSGGTWTQRYVETDLEKRSYAYTYVSVNQEEGAPRVASLTVDVGPGQPVAITGMDAAPFGSYNISTKRIYRTATIGGTTSYYLVAEIPVGMTNFTDYVDAASIGEEIPSIDWDMPPSDLEGLMKLDNGVLAGWSKNQLCFSYPYQPHAWPTSYRKTLDFDIVGGASFGNTVVAITEENPTMVTGIEPRAMSDVGIEINQGCTSKRGVASVGGAGIVYPSPDGLIFVSMSGARNITEQTISRDDWQALDPTSFNACVHNGKYFCFYDNGTTQGMFVIEPNNPDNGVVFFDLYATACYVDHLNDIMYLQVGNDIVAWDQATTNLTYRWKSKEFDLDESVTMQAGRVRASTYASLTMRLYVDGVLKHTEAVNSDQPFRMPGGYLSHRFHIEIEGTDEVKSVDIAETMSELAA